MDTADPSLWRRTQDILRRASAAVLQGFTLASDAKLIRAPERYMDDRGVTMWSRVMETLAVSGHWVESDAPVQSADTHVFARASPVLSY